MIKRLTPVAVLVLVVILAAAGCDTDEVINNPTATPATAPHATATPTVEPVDAISIFLIALGDEGISGPKVGCGDSLVPVERMVALPDDLGAQISTVLGELFSVGDQYATDSELYNALKDSTLSVQEVTVDDSGNATINLTGTVQMGGECDGPRVQGQIEQTASQFEDVKSVSVSVDGTPLDQIVSGQ